MNDKSKPELLDLARAEPGATPEALKATETISAILTGFSVQLAMSILANATAITICNFSASETTAIENCKAFRREIERCVRKNFVHYDNQRKSQ